MYIRIYTSQSLVWGKRLRSPHAESEGASLDHCRVFQGLGDLFVLPLFEILPKQDRAFAYLVRGGEALIRSMTPVRNRKVAASQIRGRLPEFRRNPSRSDDAHLIDPTGWEQRSIENAWRKSPVPN